MTKKQPPQLKVKVNDDVLRGCYANTLIVTHTAEEFVLDFVLALPPQGITNSRIIISPRHLKRIINALQQNLAAYEEKHGPLTVAPDPRSGPSEEMH